MPFQLVRTNRGQHAQLGRRICPSSIQSAAKSDFKRTDSPLSLLMFRHKRYTRAKNRREEYSNVVFGTICTEVYRRYYWYRTLRQVRYDINTGTGHFGKFGTTWMPVRPVPVQTFIPLR